MATRKEVLEVGGREVTVTNPDKVYFPEAGLHEARPRPLLPGRRRRRAARGAGGRPMALKRFVDGIDKEPFFQKRAPDNRPDWMRVGDADLPVRAGRPTRSSSTTPRAWPGSSTSAASTSTRIRSAPTTSTTPTSCASTSTRCRASSGRRSARSRWSPRRRSRRSGSSAGRRRPARAASTSTSASSARWTYPRGPPRGAGAGARRRAAGADDRHVASGGRRSATASSSTTTRTPRTARSPRPTRCGRCPTPGSRSPLRWDEVADVEPEDFTLATVPGAVRGAWRRRARASTRRSGRWRRCSSCPRATRPRAWATRRGRRTTRKQEGEPPRVQPSKQRTADDRVRQGRGEDGGPPPEVAAERAAAVAAGDRNAGLPTEWEGTRPTPTGRRKSNIPVIEIARAATKAEALEGLERWKARHPEAAAHLEPADVLVDGMRGRSSLWYRRAGQPDPRARGGAPAQEPLDPDYDPWEGYEWPDQGGQPVRAPQEAGRGRRRHRLIDRHDGPDAGRSLAG